MEAPAGTAVPRIDVGKGWTTFELAHATLIVPEEASRRIKALILEDPPCEDVDAVLERIAGQGISSFDPFTLVGWDRQRGEARRVVTRGPQIVRASTPSGQVELADVRSRSWLDVADVALSKVTVGIGPVVGAEPSSGSAAEGKERRDTGEAGPLPSYDHLLIDLRGPDSGASPPSVPPSGPEAVELQLLADDPPSVDEATAEVNPPPVTPSPVVTASETLVNLDRESLTPKPGNAQINAVPWQFVDPGPSVQAAPQGEKGASAEAASRAGHATISMPSWFVAPSPFGVDDATRHRGEPSHYLLDDGEPVPFTTRIVIGRAPEGSQHDDVTLKPTGAGRGVSRVHAEVVVIEGQAFVADLESANGTAVSDPLSGARTTLRALERVPLESGQTIILAGDVRVVYEARH